MIKLHGRQSKVELSYGARGKSAYQVAVDNGFEGTEQEWLESLVGAPGEPGKDGINGRDGRDGKDGATGPMGPAGKDGTMKFEELTEEQKASLKGDTGPQGEPGPKGDTYVLTEEDKIEIGQMVMNGLPMSEEAKF